MSSDFTFLRCNRDQLEIDQCVEHEHTFTSNSQQGLVRTEHVDPLPLARGRESASLCRVPYSQGAKATQSPELMTCCRSRIIPYGKRSRLADYVQSFGAPFECFNLPLNRWSAFRLLRIRHSGFPRNAVNKTSSGTN